LAFSESGFALTGVQAGMLGGDLRFDGSMVKAPPVAPGAPRGDATIQFKGQGTASAEGLRQAPELGLVSRLAQSATGSAGYSATLAFRRGVPELTVSSNLLGLASTLPAPLNKAADQTLPLRYENSLVNASLASPERLEDQILLDVGGVGSLQYVRDISGEQVRVLRGGMGVGLADGESVPQPDAGVAANLRLGGVDLDAWEAVLTRAAGGKVAVSAGAVQSPASQAAQGYLPTVIALRAQQVQWAGHQLHNLVIGGSRDGLDWRANLDARELSGYLDYRQSSPGNAGRVYARLTRLAIPASTATEVEALLAEQPTSVPALDIVVEDLDLRGKKLGRVEIEAVNRNPGPGQAAREWRLNKFNVTVPEASFSAVGNWAALGAAARRTAIDFKLDIADSGDLLKRLGQPGVVRRGKGVLEGQVAWLGSPLALDTPSLSGQFNLNVASGQFLKADPGLAKLLGVLSLQSLPRRLVLDFRDVFSEGFAFDFVRGDVRIEQGMASTNNMQMKGVNAAVLLEGLADIGKETQDLKVVVVPEINAGTASLVASVINPVVGITTFLTQVLLRQPLISANTQQFHIDGTWADPKITKVDRTPVATAPVPEPR
ncbi:MAG: hypothetical protein RLZZ401_278, partial [Pseudomonadota bacterium]